MQLSPFFKHVIFQPDPGTTGHSEYCDLGPLSQTNGRPQTKKNVLEILEDNLCLVTGISLLTHSDQPK